MIRIFTLAAVAAALVAAPASAHDIRISTAGKTEAQVRAEIRAAANTVCRQATASATLPLVAMGSCVSAATRRANDSYKAVVLARTKGQEVAAR